jgi:ClpP class serine protease
MKLFMLEYEIERLAMLFGSVVGMAQPEAKDRQRDPVKIRDGVATVRIVGPLYPKRNSWLDYWGEDYAVYSEIISDVAVAKSKGAKQIDFEIDSPGGYVDGLYDAMNAIANAGIPTRTIAGDVLASAAYMLASQTNEIVAEREVSAVGSIGIATTMYISDRVVDITNSDSPKKRPDASTEEGKKIVEAELDDFYQVYAEMMAKGRKISVDKVKKDYGQGAVMTARTALSKGMIDGIMQSKQSTESTAKTGVDMDPKTLKEEHRSTYDAIYNAGKEAGKEEMKALNLDRIGAYHEMAKGSGDFEGAFEAALKLEPISETVQQRYNMAAQNRDHRAARLDDNPPNIGQAKSDQIDPKSETKKGMEAAVKGLVWEVL